MKVFRFVKLPNGQVVRKFGSGPYIHMNPPPPPPPYVPRVPVSVREKVDGQRVGKISGAARQSAAHFPDRGVTVAFWEVVPFPLTDSTCVGRRLTHEIAVQV